MWLRGRNVATEGEKESQTCFTGLREERGIEKVVYQGEGKDGR